MPRAGSRQLAQIGTQETIWGKFYANRTGAINEVEYMLTDSSGVDRILREGRALDAREIVSEMARTFSGGTDRLIFHFAGAHPWATHPVAKVSLSPERLLPLAWEHARRRARESGIAGSPQFVAAVQVLVQTPDSPNGSTVARGLLDTARAALVALAHEVPHQAIMAREGVPPEHAIVAAAESLVRWAGRGFHPDWAPPWWLAEGPGEGAPAPPPGYTGAQGFVPAGDPRSSVDQRASGLYVGGELVLPAADPDALEELLRLEFAYERARDAVILAGRAIVLRQKLPGYALTGEIADMKRAIEAHDTAREAYRAHGGGVHDPERRP